MDGAGGGLWDALPCGGARRDVGRGVAEWAWPDDRQAGRLEERDQQAGSDEQANGASDVRDDVLAGLSA